jgi:hypothetical protein
LSLWCGLLVQLAGAATFKLTDGRTVTGDLIEAGSNDADALIKVDDNKYEHVPWGQFSQEDLKAFLQKYSGNKKITEAVEPFIEITQEEKAAKTEVPIKPVPRIDRPERGSVIGSLFHSGIGWFLVLVVYAANVWAGYEIAIFRARSMPLVTGLAAVPGVGFLCNIVFLALPTYVAPKTHADETYEQQEAAAPTFALPSGEAAAAEPAEAAAAAAGTAAAGPKPEVYARGQFTFNKRFFETKFPNFFGVVRREEDKEKVLIFKTSKGEFIAQRITRITPGEIYIQADRGAGASVEMPLHFPEIQEIVLKHHA